MANITPETLGNETNSSIDLAISQAANTVGDTVGTQALGSSELVGLLVLGMFGYGLWKADARIDLTAALMIPTILFLSVEGFMPYANSIIDGTLLAIAAVFAFGLARLAFR